MPWPFAMIPFTNNPQTALHLASEPMKSSAGVAAPFQRR